jgi:alpha-tubulin suppressor-like RCC1 family protein
MLVGCRRSKLPMIDHVWLGPTHGCVSHLPQSPQKTGVHCWGANTDGQLDPDGAKTERQGASSVSFKAGEPTQLALGAHHSCGVFDKGTVVSCWGAGAPTPPDAKIEEARVAVGGAHTCIYSAKSHELTCFGSNERGQTSAELNHKTEIRSFVLGDAHTCVAFAPSTSTAAIEQVECRGRGMPTQPILAGVPVKSLAAGSDHTCALIHDGTVRCWGKNDQGQLGDGTTTDATTEPVAVLDVKGAVQIAAGARHSCAHLWNGTVACWGDNRHHQLANGATTSTGHAGVIVGLIQVKELVAAGDGSSARLEDRSVRCWGLNDKYQLGTGSTVEQSVPMSIRYQ